MSAWSFLGSSIHTLMVTNTLLRYYNEHRPHLQGQKGPATPQQDCTRYVYASIGCAGINT